jgi:hypothetical protein
MPAPVAGTDTALTALTALTAPKPHEFDGFEPLAVADEQFAALPLFSTEALLWPPSPPVASAEASPDLPVVAAHALSSLPVQYAVAGPVSPEVALLVASPPLASWFWVMSPPSDVLSLFDVTSFVDVELPEVALPEVSPSSSPPPELLLVASLPLFESPPVASELLLLDALPLPDTLASLVPPLPPCADDSASPDLPDFAVTPESSPLLEPLLDAPLTCLQSLPAAELEDASAHPVVPDVAWLEASPPLAS